MRFKRKILSCLAAAVLTMVFLPSSIASAESAMITIYGGETMVLEPGTSIPASSTSGISVAAKNLSGEYIYGGLGGITLNFAWDGKVIRVDSIEVSAEALAGGWSIVRGEPDNTSGTVTVTGFTTNYPTSDITLLYFGITAIGNPGQSTILGMNTAEFLDSEGRPTGVVPVDAMVRIVGAKYITVTPSSTSITAGDTLQYFAEIMRSDGLKENITELATWTSNNQMVARIQTSGESNPGLATGIAEGITTLSAEYEGVRSSVVLTVSTVKKTPETAGGNSEPIEEDTGETPEPDTPVEMEDTTEPIEEKPETSEPDTPADTEDTTGPVEEKPETTEITEPDTTVETDEEPEATQETLPPATEDVPDRNPNSASKVAWIIGGVVAAVAVLGFLGFTFFTRHRY